MEPTQPDISYVVVLRRMFNRKKIGKHSLEESVAFKWVKNLQQFDWVEKKWQECLNKGWILRKKKAGQWHVSLNPKKLPEILATIKP